MSKKEIVCENVEGKLYVLDIVHVMRHIDVLTSDYLLVLEIIFCKI